MHGSIGRMCHGFDRVIIYEQNMKGNYLPLPNESNRLVLIVFCNL